MGKVESWPGQLLGRSGASFQKVSTEITLLELWDPWTVNSRQKMLQGTEFDPRGEGTRGGG